MVNQVLPPERLAALRKAFDETMADSSFLAEAKQEGMEKPPVSGLEVQALVSRILAAPPDIAERARSDGAREPRSGAGSGDADRMNGG